MDHYRSQTTRQTPPAGRQPPGQTPLTPFGQTRRTPLGQTPPGRQTPSRQAPLWADTPLDRLGKCNTLVLWLCLIFILIFICVFVSSYPLASQNKAKPLFNIRQWPLQSLKVFHLLFCGLRTPLLCTSHYLRPSISLSIGLRLVTLWVNVSLS